MQLRSSYCWSSISSPSSFCSLSSHVHHLIWPSCSSVLAKFRVCVHQLKDSLSKGVAAVPHPPPILPPPSLKTRVFKESEFSPPWLRAYPPPPHLLLSYFPLWIIFHLCTWNSAGHKHLLNGDMAFSLMIRKKKQPKKIGYQHKTWEEEKREAQEANWKKLYIQLRLQKAGSPPLLSFSVLSTPWKTLSLSLGLSL